MRYINLVCFGSRCILKRNINYNTCILYPNYYNQLLFYHPKYIHIFNFNANKLSSVLYNKQPEEAKINISYEKSNKINELKNDSLKSKSNIVEEVKINDSDKSNKVEEEKDYDSLSLWQKFKYMMKRYWYVLVPVHAITTGIWLFSFWYAAKCGLDVVPLLEKLNLPEKFIEPIKKSGATYFAAAYAMYKVISPIRYAVTIGVSTFLINILRKRGLIKPVPSRKEIKKFVYTLREHRIKRRKKKKST